MNTDNARTIADIQFNQLLADLEAGRSATLRAFLDLNARFYRYSTRNLLLILAQRPDATHVAGFHAWKCLGRHVKRGEEGIAILAPVTRTQVDRETEERTRVRVAFRITYVFDVSQTDGRPLPTLEQDPTGAPALHLSKLEQAIRQADVTLVDADELDGALGSCEAGTIRVLRSLTPPDRFSVLVHEWAHALLHHGVTRPTNKTVRETEAEAVAYIVSSAIGVTPSVHSADYIGLYDGTADTLRTSLDRIQRTAVHILDAIGVAHNAQPDVAGT